MGFDSYKVGPDPIVIYGVIMAQGPKINGYHWEVIGPLLITGFWAYLLWDGSRWVIQ